MFWNVAGLESNFSGRMNHSMDVLLDYIQGSENNYLGTVNDRLSILGAHLETKAFFFWGGGGGEHK